MKVGDLVEVIAPTEQDENQFHTGDIFVISAVEVVFSKRIYRRSNGMGDFCYEREIRLLPKASKLNKKLYPNYVEKDGWLYPKESK